MAERKKTVMLANRVAESSKKRPRLSTPQQRRYHCPHCQQSLTSKTFMLHKKFHTKEDGTWVIKEKAAEKSLDEWSPPVSSLSTVSHTGG